MQKIVLFIIAILVNVTACGSSQPNQLAAPLDDKDALEKLAAAYETAAESIPVSPTQLRPQARKQFVEKVFSDAGYSYTATLQALSKVDPNKITQYHKDIKQLLYLPHYGIPF
ncbi:MAG: hypothetical protein R3240_07780 [Gammaproteobacteria bacterium]|nr:hypothetical protein [Gammaproteobacteria bacterium]